MKAINILTITALTIITLGLGLLFLQAMISGAAKKHKKILIVHAGKDTWFI